MGVVEGDSVEMIIAQIIIGVLFAVAGFWAIHDTRKRATSYDVDARIFALSASIFIFIFGFGLLLVSVIFLVFG